MLGLVVSDYLFRPFPDCPEGEMTRIKSAVVSRVTCAEVWLNSDSTGSSSSARDLSAGPVRPTPSRCRFSLPPSKAIIAGVYLDQGYEAAEG
ncbi:MAG: hypothetical protein Ct9H300mP1_22590 [Planctomycetaceae bacterium]|nr:MAG: hypothetical protein Ct9H300mP1_22590 [Planctomycetaceae bacterium]